MVKKISDNSPVELIDEINMLYKMGIDYSEINYLLRIKIRRYDGGDD